MWQMCTCSRFACVRPLHMQMKRGQSSEMRPACPISSLLCSSLHHNTQQQSHPSLISSSPPCSPSLSIITTPEPLISSSPCSLSLFLFCSSQHTSHYFLSSFPSFTCLCVSRSHFMNTVKTTAKMQAAQFAGLTSASKHISCITTM